MAGIRAGLGVRGQQTCVGESGDEAGNVDGLSRRRLGKLRAAGHVVAGAQPFDHSPADVGNRQVIG